MDQYRCFMRSTPGPYEQYDGQIEVWAESDNWSTIFRAAIRTLQAGAFPDRGPSMWTMDDFLLIRRGENAYEDFDIRR